MVNNLLILFTCSLYTVYSSELIYTIGIFRHGARAPSAQLINTTRSHIFQNGLGELTPKGIQESWELGLFLKKRYVDTKFLRDPFKVNEIKVLSRAINRCLMTANAVTSAMYANASHGPFVPIYSQQFNDTVLDYSFTTCQEEPNYLKRHCKEVPSLATFQTWPEYEAFVFDCLELHKTSKFFKSRKDFEEAEAFINEELNDMKLDKDFSLDLHFYYNKVYRFIIGAGEYHDPRLLRAKGGHLMYNIHQQLVDKWRCHLGECHKKASRQQKMFLYSTQDWIVSIILEILGPEVNKKAVGDEYPEYNSMILIELYDDNGSPFIKVLYKRSASSEDLIDVTPSIRNCRGASPCHLSLFTSCCSMYTTNDPIAACNASLP